MLDSINQKIDQLEKQYVVEAKELATFLNENISRITGKMSSVLKVPINRRARNLIRTTEQLSQLHSTVYEHSPTSNKKGE